MIKVMRRAGTTNQAKKQGMNLEALKALGKTLEIRAIESYNTTRETGHGKLTSGMNVNVVSVPKFPP